MTAFELIDILDETEDIYLDGELNGYKLPEPINHLLFEDKEIAKIRRTVKTYLLMKKDENSDMKIFVEKGDSFNFVIANNIESSLVLNFANPVHVGGGVRRGAKAQEEDLCRASNLLYALESENVKSYYKTNRRYNNLGSDNAILTEHVSIIRETNGKLLEKPIDVDVLTIAAPILPILSSSKAREDELYQRKLGRRIETILDIAQYYGYKTLILGAWGCGAFNNAPEDVARLFHKYLSENNYEFEKVYFVIKADSKRGMHNFEVFERNMG